jgi:hypothetical protein
MPGEFYGKIITGPVVRRTMLRGAHEGLVFGIGDGILADFVGLERNLVRGLFGFEPPILLLIGYPLRFVGLCEQARNVLFRGAHAECPAGIMPPKFVIRPADTVLCCESSPGVSVIVPRVSVKYEDNSSY